MDCHLKLQRPMSQDFDLLSWNLSLPRPLSCKKSRNLNNKMFWKTRNYLTQKVSLPLLTHNIGKQYLWNIRMRDFIFYTYLVMIFYTILDWYWEGGGQNWTRNSNCGGGPIFFYSVFFFNCRPECPQLVESQLVLPVFHRILHPETKKKVFF